MMRLMKYRRVAVDLTAVFASVIVVLGIAATPVAAQPSPQGSCYGAACDGFNPAQFGCDADGTTVRSLDVPGGTIQLRYSRSCAANWARATYGGWGYIEPYVWNPNSRSY